MHATSTAWIKTPMGFASIGSLLSWIAMLRAALQQLTQSLQSIEGIGRVSPDDADLLRQDPVQDGTHCRGGR